MTIRHQIELESFFLISLVAASSLFFVVQKNSQGQFAGTRIASFNSPLITNEPKQDTYSQISPDGTKKVIMKIDRNRDDTQTYSFYTGDDVGVNEQLIFSKTLDRTKYMRIPFNTFSSDNKYFFIQENAKEGTSIFAFKTSGEPFSDTEAYFDVTDLFKKRETGNNFAEATGWASESLIIINTTREDGKKGPSYWFEVPSKAILILATEF